MASVIEGTSNSTIAAMSVAGARMAQENGAMRTMDPNLYRAPEYFVYIFTVSKKRHVRLMSPLFRSLLIPACAADQRYRAVARIPHPMPQIEPNPHNMGEQPQITYWHDAKRVAQDVCNPNNPTLDQNFAMRTNIDRNEFMGWCQIGSGQNLNEQGVFWSMNEEPTEEEIAAAEARRDGYFRFLLGEIDRIADSDPLKKDLITNDHHMACERFGEERAWHQAFSVKQDCPNCGMKIKAGLAWHMNEGQKCVIDPLKALKSRGISKAEYDEIMDVLTMPEMQTEKPKKEK